MAVPEYADELLTLAVDLGGRLLAAFDGCNVLLTRTLTLTLALTLTLTLALALALTVTRSPATTA